MKKERKAQILTVAVLAAACGAVAIRQAGWKPPRPAAPATPQEAIYAMLDAAREGDVRKYLGAYTGRMAASLRQAVAESTERGFSKYLRESNEAVKGIAVLEPEVLTDGEVRVRVEYVYQDRNEVQRRSLEKTPAGWKIARVDSAERIKTLVPYGTPVQ